MPKWTSCGGNMSEGLTQCHRCQLESPLAELFRISSETAGRRVQLCPVCWRKQQALWSRGRFKAVAIMGLVGAIIPDNGLGVAFWFLSLVYFANLLLTLPHELGHALAGWMTGFRIFRIEVGCYGPRWLNLHLAGYSLEFRGTMECGLAMPATLDKCWLRVRSFLLSAGGPLVHVMLIAATLWLTDRFEFADWLGNFMLILLVANLWLLAISMWPYRFEGPDGVLENDGLCLWRLMTASHGQFEGYALSYFFLETSRLLKANRADQALVVCDDGLSHFPQDITLQIMRGICRLSLSEFATARKLLLDIQDQPETTPENLAIAQSNLAYANLLSRDPDLLDEAEVMSGRAIRAVPWMAEVKSVRGCVLIEVGQVEQGVGLLRQAFQELEEKSERAWVAIFLARGLATQERFKESEQMMRTAQRLGRNYEWVNEWMPTSAAAASPASSGV